MKKYSIVLGVLLVAGLIIYVPTVKATDVSVESETNVNVEAGGTNPTPTLFGKTRPTYDVKTNTKREALREEMKSTREAFEDKLKTNREAFRATVEKEKEDFKNSNLERKNKFWGAADQILGKKFEEAITRLENVQVKIGEVLVKLNADGKNTIAAQADLDASKQKIADAKVKLGAAKLLLPTDGSKITPEIFAEIKIDVREVKDLLKESRNYLMNVLQDIKGLRGEANAGVKVESKTEVNESDSTEN